jgi:hypothetical protein
MTYPFLDKEVMLADNIFVPNQFHRFWPIPPKNILRR